MKMKIHLIMILTVFSLLGQSCVTSLQVDAAATVNLPFLKNSHEECYYLDEFMPTPNRMVTGQSGALGLRYYSYTAANYKDWEDQEIVLSFYSRDQRCWSLFEEYYLKK